MLTFLSFKLTILTPYHPQTLQKLSVQSCGDFRRIKKCCKMYLDLQSRKVLWKWNSVFSQLLAVNCQPTIMPQMMRLLVFYVFIYYCQFQLSSCILIELVLSNNIVIKCEKCGATKMWIKECFTVNTFFHTISSCVFLSLSRFLPLSLSLSLPLSLLCLSLSPSLSPLCFPPLSLSLPLSLPLSLLSLSFSFQYYR